MRAGTVKIDTGSGNVRLDLLADLQALDVDTGSGDVTINVPPDLGAELDIETGSGDIDLQNVTIRTTRLERDHLTGAIGDGKGPDQNRDWLGRRSPRPGQVALSPRAPPRV